MNKPQGLTLNCVYEEMIPAGKDFRSREVVAGYDAYHRRFRDIDAENAATIAALNLRASHTLADFGSGTGAFVLQAARHCAKVHAIDISRAMLDYTEWKAQAQGITNVACHHGGFLTYAHTDPLLDVITSSLALHHLPDFWKQKALVRLSGMLKPGGRFVLADVVFSDKDYEANIARWIEETSIKAGPEMGPELTRHVCTEYSTFTWILEGLLERAGFRIDRAEHTGGVLSRYFCTKN